MRKMPLLLWSALLLSPFALHAQEAGLLQADILLRARNHRTGVAATFDRPLAGGEARVRGSLLNLPRGETALVVLEFNYKTPADIALDEIIHSIVIVTYDADGNEWSRSKIEPNEINLNPNRVPLYYSATLYTPPTQRYTARILVYGNYE